MTDLDNRARMPVRINGVGYQIDLQSYRRTMVDATRQLNDQGGETSEQTLNSQYVWKRTAEDWRLAAGQSVFDLVEESSRRRFFDSVGIDPWTPRALTLLPEATQRYVDDDLVAEAFLFVVGGQLVYAQNVVNASSKAVIGCSINFVDDPEAASWSLTTIISAPSDQIESIVADGNALYYKLAGGNQIKRLVVTGLGTTSSSNIGDAADLVTNLRIVSGRLLGQQFDSNPEELVEVKAATTETIATYEVGQMPIITGAVPGPDGLYLACITDRAAAGIDWSGVHTTIYRSTIAEDDGAIQVPAPVSALPDGEAITSMLAYSGYLVLGTSLGIRLAHWTATGGVEYGPAIRVSSAPNVATNTSDSAYVRGVYSSGVQCLEGEGQYVWFGWANKVFTDHHGLSSYHSGLGRLDLARFVSDLQPAYASDLMVADVDHPVSAVVSYQGRRYFSIPGLATLGQADTVVPSGTLVTGAITYGTAEPKQGTTLELATEAMPNAAAIMARVVDQFDDVAVSVGFVGQGGHSFSTDITAVAGESMTLHLELCRGIVETEAPTLRRWTLRALVVPERNEEIWLPIVLTDEVSHAEVDVPLDIHGEFADLRALMQARTIVPLEMGDEAIYVFIDAIVTGSDEQVRLRNWNNDESWGAGLWFIKCVTI